MSAPTIRMRLPLWILSSLVAGLLVACGPSREAMDATVPEVIASPTTQAPTATNRPTSTPLPTNTPLPTPTHTPTETPLPTLTPTPAPEPDPHAILNWQAVNSPPIFSAYAPSAIGIGQDEVAFELEVDGKMKAYSIVNSFLFADEAQSELVYGYTISLPTAADQDNFDQFVINSSFGLRVQDLPMDQIGDITRWITGEVSASQLLDNIRVRLDDVGVVVFIRYPVESTPSIPPDQLMQVYAESILNPETGCRLVSVKPVEGAEWPTFEVVAEGFYPGEKRAVLLAGEVIIAGESQRALLGNMGLTDDAIRVDSQGNLTDSVVFGPIEGQDIELAQEYELTIMGHYSGCEIETTVEWPGEP